jgi:Fur family ferric uptake transcriptional regulator
MRYRTRQGDMILECLKAQGSRHMTAEDIRAALRDKGESVGQATVYRHLDRLVREGVAVRYAGASGQGACYQYIGCGDDSRAHYHLVCSGCGRMIHMECSYMDEVTAHLLDHHQFCVDRFRTVISGLCRQCADKRL